MLLSLHVEPLVAFRAQGVRLHMAPANEGLTALEVFIANDSVFTRFSCVNSDEATPVQMSLGQSVP